MVGLTADLLWIDTIGFSQTIDDVGDKSRFVALATLGNGSHVRGIGLEDDAIQGDSFSQGFGQMAFLEGEHATYAQHKLWEVKELACLLDVACETMEHASWQLVGILTKNGNELVLGFATVYHQGQARFYRPAHLLLESKQLFVLELTAPIEVEAYLTNGQDGGGGMLEADDVPDGLQLLTPIGMHLLWV